MKFNLLPLVLLFAVIISCKKEAKTESNKEENIELKVIDTTLESIQKTDSLMLNKEEFDIDNNAKNYLLDPGLNIKGTFKWNTNTLEAHQTDLAVITVPEYVKISLLNLEYCESKKQLLITYKKVNNGEVPILSLDVTFNEVLSTKKNEKITVYRFDATGTVDLDQDACTTIHGHPGENGDVYKHEHKNGHTTQDSLNIKGIDGIKSATSHKLKSTGTIIIGKKP